MNNLNMPDIWETVSDSMTITIYKQNVRLQGGICNDKFQIDQIQNDPAIINFNMPDNYTKHLYSIYTTST